MLSIPDKLLVNLKILSKIQKNGRICRSYDGIIALEHETIYQPLKRFLTSDSRRQAVFEINSIIDETIQILNHILNSKFSHRNHAHTNEFEKNCEMLGLLITELTSSRIGIENLKFTYQTDPNIASQLDITLMKINSTIKDTQLKLQNLRSSIELHTIVVDYQKQNDPL